MISTGMTMRTLVLAVVVAMGTAGVQGARAQSPIPLAMEGRVAAAFPVGDFADRGDNGFGFGAGAAVQVLPGVAVYGSWSRTTFDIPSLGERSAVEEGFSAGLTVAVPGGGMLQPWVGAGVVWHSLELNFDVNEHSSDPGLELAAGVAIPLAPHLRLTPAVGYRRWKAGYTFLEGGDVVVTEDYAVEYFTAGVGLSIAL
jgi:opacity protein-like surface antigen